MTLIDRTHQSSMLTHRGENLFQIVRWDGEALHTGPDELALEAPLEIRVRRQAVTVTMRTPGHDAELAAGFLVAEGIVHDARDIVTIEPCPDDEAGNTLKVVLAPQVRFDTERLTRRVLANSSCGLCGRTSIEALEGQFPRIESKQRFAAEALATWPDAMRTAQATFERTGGLHAAALFQADGRMLVLREDVGRHNAVDKVIGHCLLRGEYPLDRHALLVSGRASFEIVQKALAAGVPLIAAVSAPSSLAVELAIENGQTLVGFLRGRRMNIYSHPQRVTWPA